MTAFGWTDRTVREALGLRTENAADEHVYEGVSTDSRTIGEGDLYVALVGERFDGHDFVADAAAAGAAGAVVSHPVVGADRIPVYPVADTLVALGRLARYRRDRLPARVVGITGSSGKTSTKELVRAALATTLRVHATPANLNNRIGVPRTLLTAPEDAQVVVVEMGTNEPGEIAILTDIVRPDVGVLTTVGESHLEKLGSVEGVLKEKLDILRGMEPEDTVAVVGSRPRSLPRAAREVHPRVRVAGTSREADDDLRPEEVEADGAGRHRFRWRGREVRLSLPGAHVVENAMLALAVAEELHVDPADAAEGIAGVEAAAMRGEEREVGGLTLILDCYNANPQSVRAALDLLELRGERDDRVAVLGTMLELGERSDALHREVLADALGRELALVAATGDFARAAERLEEAGELPESGIFLLVAFEPELAFPELRKHLGGDEVVLLKASRGVALEELVPLFEEAYA